MKKIILTTLLFLFLHTAYFILYTSVANAATLYISPPTGSYNVGQTFSVGVYVSSANQAMNAASGVISFPPDKLEVVSLSKSDSLFNFWVQEPAFYNTLGTINFEGIVFNPGFTGSVGKIITVSFRIKAVGSASLTFSSGSVLANDGKGTNILANMGSGSYVFTDRVITPPLVSVPAGPIISSPTHPDSEEWYSNNDPKFVWKLPSDVNAVRLLVGRIPAVQPNVLHIPPISERQLENLDNGIWYFSSQFRNAIGWGPIGRFKFQIDTVPPLPFKIEVKEGKKTTNPQPTLSFKTIDEVSGIDYYEIIIGNQEPIRTDQSEYKIPAQDLGIHTVIVKAVDKAGNETLAMTEIEILPIETPVITDYPRELLPNNILSIKGTAIPEATIIVFIQKNEEEAKIGETKSDREGKWSFVEIEPVEKGVYQIWVEAVDASGAKSKLSEKVTILVSSPIFIRIGKLAIDYLTTIITLLVLILVIILMILWIWREIRKKRKKIQKETIEAEKVLIQAFKVLKEETEKQVAKLDGKPNLSDREKKICDELKEALEISEKFIGKEIKDIEREL